MLCKRVGPEALTPPPLEAARVDGDERMGLFVRTVRDRVVPARHPFPLYLWGTSLSEARKKRLVASATSLFLLQYCSR